tara:strand:- start:287 stop:1525 length:1239 start_codon:yes stop_codon:yes gene_type:complete
VGSGGREHAIAWKLASSPKVDQVFVAPGNGGTEAENLVRNVDIDPMNFADLADFAFSKNVQLTVVGPEEPLVEGIVEYFSERGLLCFGPSQAAARLEGSKSFAKRFLQKYKIPTAGFQVFETGDSAVRFVKTLSAPIVIKKDGLASGKGVFICETIIEAEEVIRKCFSEKKSGFQGLLIEDFIKGEELSYIALVDGADFKAFSTSQDYKRAKDGGIGLNTGGMGAYSPVSFVDDALEQKIVASIVTPTLRGMISEGSPYRGFLYFGLMVDPSREVYVIEYNCRFGDPETQPIMMRLKSDLYTVILAALEGRLSKTTLSFDDRTAVSVVMASRGYPQAYEIGHPIKGLENLKEAKVFHSGTKVKEDVLKTNGGRVLAVTAMGSDISEARRKAYESVHEIHFFGQTYRTDIGRK